MDNPFATTSPTRLYALLLKLRPIQYGTLMPFSGELVHAAWLNWLRAAAPEVATWLHEGNRRRLFTCSSLQFPVPPARMREAEKENTHLPVTPEKTCTIRITLLLGELFPLFYNALADFNLTALTGDKRPPFIQIGKQTFLLEEVIADPENSTGWANFTSFTDLVEKVRATKLRPTEQIKLEFASLTTFNRSSARTREYGSHHAVLPLPEYVFSGLARRWQELAPPELADIIQKDPLEQYIKDDGIIITDYDLRAHHVKFTTHLQSGFIGKCQYTLRTPDDAAEGGLSIRQQLLLLAQLSFYCGVGYKTAMGMGQARLL